MELKLEKPDVLEILGQDIWSLNDLKGMSGKVQNRAIFMLLTNPLTKTPFLAVINPPIMTEQYKALVQQLQRDTGATVEHLISMGYKHHLYQPQWLKEFPQARSHMFPRDAAQPEQKDCSSSITPYDVEAPEKILEALVSTGQVQVVLHRGVGDGMIPTFTGASIFGPYRYNLWLYHKPSRSLVSGCQAWGEAKEGGPEPWVLKKFLGLKPGTVNVWGKILNPEQCNETYKKVLTWDFETYVPIHGPIIRQARSYVTKALERHANEKYQAAEVAKEVQGTCKDSNL